MYYRPLYFSLQAVIGILMLGWIWSATFPSSAPRTPDSQHIIPYNNHGTTVYMTRWQAAFGPATFMGLMAAAIAGEYCRNRMEHFKSKYFV